MAQAKCPGCGETGSSKAINSHMGGCPRYAERFAAGEEMRSPEDEFRQTAAKRAVATAPRPPRAPRPKVSDPAATVSEPVPPKRTTRRSGSVGETERVPGPVNVEVWEVPQSL